MRNKSITVILVLLIVFLTSCSNPHNSISGATTATSVQNNSDKPHSGWPPPPQPILFDDIDAAIAFVKNPVFRNHWNDDFRAAYRQMVSVFQNDGYITTVSHSTATVFDNTVTLYPEATYEDIGVHYYFWFNEKLYQVLIYTVKEGDDYSIDLQTETVSDYYNKRWNVEVEFDDVGSTQHPLINSVYFNHSDELRLWALSMLDETHYVVVRGNKDEVDKSMLVEFIEGLSFDKAEIE